MKMFFVFMIESSHVMSANLDVLSFLLLLLLFFLNNKSLLLCLKSFGHEVDYKLVQDAYRNQKNFLYCNCHYHFKKPRVVKKLDSLRKVSDASHTKAESKYL